MRPMIKTTSLIATTALWIAPTAVAIPVLPILAPPQRTLSNGLNALYVAPGLGVELELFTLVYISTVKKWEEIDTAGREALKGATLIPTDFPGGPQTNWKLTAEISPANLITEIIVDGQTNKVGGFTSERAGLEINQYMTDWWRFCGDKTQINEKCYATVVPDLTKTNPWEAQWRQEITHVLFQPQVTTGMPMEGVLQVLKDGKAQSQGNVLINTGQAYNQKIILVTEDSFKPFLRIRRSDINDEFLGFFSLLVSYCAAASEGDPAHGPKRGLNIMPRTNFLTMYNIFARDKLQNQFALTSLYDVVRVIAALEPGRNIDIANMKFKWKSQDLRNPISEDWPGKAADMQSGELTVKEFLDTLQGKDTPQLDLLMLMDKMVRHGQIGGLGKRMEGVYGALDKPAPIFEFRDLANVNRNDLSARMDKFDKQVIALHAKATQATLGTHKDKSEPSSSSDVEIKILIQTSPDQQETELEKIANSRSQDQELKATKNTPLPAEQYNCEAETEAEKPGQGIMRPKDQSWWLLAYFRRYIDPSNRFPVGL